MAENTISLGPVYITPSDGWKESAEHAEFSEKVGPEHSLHLEFARVSIVGTGKLSGACVQLYLDDTSNFDLGAGNTRFLHMSSSVHGDGEGNMSMSNVSWPMCGALKEGGHVKMPDVAKIVVTGEGRLPGMPGPFGVQEGKTQHGVIGGTAFPLRSMLDAMKMEGQGAYVVPIYNSFIGNKLGPSPLVSVVFDRMGKNGTINMGETELNEKLNTLFQPSALPHVKEAYVLSHLLPPAINELWADRVDQGLYAAPHNISASFTGLNREQKYAALNAEPVKAMFRGGGTRNARLLGQIYPYNVASLPGMYNEGEQTAITEKGILLHSYHAGLSMFTGYGWTTKTLFQKVASGDIDQELCSFVGYTLCAVDTLPSTQEYVSDYWIVPNLPPNHSPEQKSVAEWFAVPGEDWQVANASMASWNPDMTWSPSGHDDCESKFHHILNKHLSFVELAGGKGTGIISDSMKRVKKAIKKQAVQILHEKAPVKLGKKTGIIKKATHVAEQLVQKRRSDRNLKAVEMIKDEEYARAHKVIEDRTREILKKIRLPKAAHRAVENMKEQVFFETDHIIQDRIKRITVSGNDIGFGNGEEEAAGGSTDLEPVEIVGMRRVVKNVREEVFHSEHPYENDIPDSACDSLKGFAQYCLNEKKGMSDEDRQTFDLVHGIALLSGIMASDAYKLEGILGTAFGGAVGSKVKKEGGHMYGLQVLGGYSAILEGTASVENRMNVEKPEHAKSIMKFEKGLCIAMQSVWLNGAFDRKDAGETGLPEPKFKPMMVSSNLGHTEDFYGKACIASHGRTYAQATANDSGPHGSYLFTKNEEANGQLEFGLDPEFAMSPDSVFAEVVGTMVDRSITENSDFARVAALDQDMNPHASISVVSGAHAQHAFATGAPFTDAVNSTVKAVREICGQRVPRAHWKKWMRNMYGEDLHMLPMTAPVEEFKSASFTQAGHLARVVMTFNDAAETKWAQEFAHEVLGGHLANPKSLEEILRRVKATSLLLPEADHAALSHAIQVTQELGEGSIRMHIGRTLNTLIVSLRTETPIHDTLFKGPEPDPHTKPHSFLPNPFKHQTHTHKTPE